MYRIVVLAALIAVFTSCSPHSGRPAEDEDPSRLTPARLAQIHHTVGGLVEGFWDAWASADIDGGIGYFAEDATAVTKTGAILRGRESIDAAWRPGFATIAGQTIEFSESFVSVYGPDLASVHQVGSFLVKHFDGTTEGPIPFTYTTVWILRDNAWQIIVAHRTDPPDPVASGG